MAGETAANFGSAVALQGKVAPKTSHLGENFLRGFQVGSNEKSKKKKEEADLLEFDSSAAAKLAPRNFQKYMKLQQEAVTQYKKDRETLGADKARQLFIQKKYEPNGILENANKIVYSDTQAKQHLKESQDGNVAAQAALLSQYLQGTDDTDPVNTGKYDKLNQPDLGIQLTPEGYFQGVQYKKPNWETVFNNAKTNNTPDPKTLKNTPLANGHTLSTITSVPTPETEESLTGMAVSDQATFVDQIDKHRDEWKQMGYDIDNPDSAIRIPEQRRAFKEQFVSPQLRNKTSYYNIGEPRRETEAEKKSRPRVDGNTVTIGNAIWSYSADGEQEIFTPSRTDVTENKVFDFTTIKDGKKVDISGRVKNIVAKKGGTPVINIVVSDDVRYSKDGATFTIKANESIEIPYAIGDTKNIDKIRNEYNANPYDIRDMVTGSLKVPTSEVSGKATTNVGRDLQSSQKSTTKTFDYSQTGLENKAAELKITVEELKKKILAKKPNATFE